jgi:large subunit ribosomal protein L24
MAKSRIRKDDLVKVISGSSKGKTGKVVRTDLVNKLVYVEKIGIVNRHIKPSQTNPRGGTKEVHVGIPAGKVALVVDAAKGKTTRIGYSTTKDGKKIRIAKSTGKEIK